MWSPLRHRLVRGLLALSGCVLPLHGICAGDGKSASARPNILLVIADDLGFSDIAPYGGEIHTPNLDRLAREGVRFTRFYNSARCWPTRSNIMTGYYAPQTGSDPNRGTGNYTTWHSTLPKIMGALGYRTYHSGKWHVQGTGCDSAHSAGFHRAYDMTQGWIYYTPFYHALDGKMLPRPGPDDGYFMDIAIGDRMKEFLEQHYAEHADAPFFAYLSFCGPHYPLKAPQQYIDKYKGCYDPGWDAIRSARLARMKEQGFPTGWKLAEPEPNVISPHSPQDDAGRAERDKALGFADVYRYQPWDSLSPERQHQQARKMEIHAAMVDLLDEQIGKALAVLEKNGALDNTLVLFLSDNGADCTQMVPGEQLEKSLTYDHDPAARWGSEHTALSLGPSWATACNTPFRRHKIWLHEGGTSTPLIAHWPRGITAAPGTFVDSPGHVVDFLPTFVDLAGGKLEKPSPEAPPYPGRSLAPALAGGTVDRDFIYFKHDGNRALIQWPWKIVSAKIDDNQWELYDLGQDRTEQHNLAADQPERLRAMVRTWTGLDNEYKQQGGYNPPTPP